MRPIKYRAWWVKDICDEPIGIMLHEVQDFYDTLGSEKHGNEFEPESSFGAILASPSQYIVMQFTGLKDSKGVDIYEKDYVHIKRKDNYFCREDFEETILVGEPEYYELSDKLSGGPDGSYPVIWMEVIGNLFENPELIEGNSND